MYPPTLIRHLHLPGVTSFSIVQALQNLFVTQHLSHKALASSANPPQNLPPPPPPTILTFQPTPVYTTGRREQESLTSDQLSRLTSPLVVKTARYQHTEIAEVVPTLRGGQTTFHGPGQLVLYPILDLRSSFPQWKNGIGVRCYVNLLEQCTINTLSQWNLTGVRTENPGVWDEEGKKKIAALGVHLRRNVSSYGVGLNVTTPLQWFERIVACGLVGKGTTSMLQLGLDKKMWKGGGNSRSERLAWGQKKQNSMFKDMDAESAMEQDDVWSQGARAEEEKRNKVEDNYDIQEDGRWATKDKTSVQLRQRLKPGVVGRTWVREFAQGLYGEGGEEKIQKVDILDIEELTDVADEHVRKFLAEQRVLQQRLRRRNFLNGKRRLQRRRNSRVDDDMEALRNAL